jgi:hypothetical protein
VLQGEDATKFLRNQRLSAFMLGVALSFSQVITRELRGHRSEVKNGTAQPGLESYPGAAA